MRKIIPINNEWYYSPQYKKGVENSISCDGFQVVNLPHTNIQLPYNYFDEKAYQFVSCYKYPLNISSEYKEKIICVQFEGVMAYSKIYVNGVFIGEHKGGYTPFEFRIDHAIDFENSNNTLTVIVDSTERNDIPPFGGQIDYLTYGGIYRDVSLCIYDKVFIKNIKIETLKILEQEKGINLRVYIENILKNQNEAKFSIKINKKNGNEIYYKSFIRKIKDGENIYDFHIEGLKDVELWNVETPNLYEINVSIDFKDFYDEYKDKFGFRKAEFKPNGFYLNGKKLKLRGLNRHQSFPYVGYAMPKRVQEKDAIILKNDMHLNIVRASHYPQSKHFLNKCDEIGLLVFEEIPGWQHIGNDEWKEVAKENVREMIINHWNHPSIILWGVRINESNDDDEFYTDTNRIAHELDASRQTGGVRYITESNLLEDVYTFNDFIHDGIEKPLRNQNEVTGLNYKVPYMVTEFNGHMYPTKRFDQEERQMEHSLRHLRVLNECGLDDSISGAIGWCAFDYNTHKDFGSGDRICHHGVMDMFRINKFASYAYKSQVSPEIEAVLEPITFWARGERSIGGIIPLVIFTNCDYIELQYGDKVIRNKILPRYEEYKGLEYPPVIIDYSVISPEEAGEWGMVWEDAILRGYHKDEKIIEKKLCKNPIPKELYVKADDEVLNSFQKDATRVVVKILDQCGNLMPFLDEIIKIEVDGPASLQGPNEVVLKGGAIAFWIETINHKGKVSIRVKSQRIGEQNISIDVK